MISDREIWNNLGIYSDIGIKFCNPFRDDKNPSAILKEWRGRLILNDWGSSEWNGLSALKCYAKVHNLTHEEALKELRSKLGFIRTPLLVKKTLKEEKIYEPFFKAFSQEGINYWKARGVTDLENINEISGFKYTLIEEGLIVKEYKIKCKTLSFSYKFTDTHGKIQYKIYSPFEDKGKKFSGTVSAWNVWWFLQNSTTLLSLKASKDFKVVKAIVVKYNLKVDLHHWQSERVAKVKSKIPNYLTISSYTRHIVVFDNDTTGKEGADLCKVLLGSEAYFTPVGKDIDEMYCLAGETAVLNWLLTFL